VSDWAATERIPAEVLLVDGTSVAGDLHLQPRTALHEGRETPLELLNRDDAFLPVTQNGGVVFISKAQVVRVNCAADTLVPDPERASAAKRFELRVELRIELAGRHEVRGWTSVELPPTRGRLLDYLNSAERFFTILTDDSTCYINRAHVRLVHPLD
jgi:hypothetical protein